VALFLALTTLAFIVPKWMTTPHSAKVPGLDIGRSRTGGKPHEMGTVDRTSRLVGRIGRTTGEFANGVGRVWIEGAEWAAELESGEDGVPPEAPVRVTRVVGGVRLQVQGLDR
jgi:membrane protein implicated in regulation of membrane protease activity